MHHHKERPLSVYMWHILYTYEASKHVKLFQTKLQMVKLECVPALVERNSEYSIHALLGRLGPYIYTQ